MDLSAQSNLFAHFQFLLDVEGSFPLATLTAPVCLCWAPALGFRIGGSCLYSLFSSLPSSFVDVEGAVTVLKIALV